ncbi:J domain-containing protein [Rhizobium sp. Root482]|uniref:J domain-containing protein n=1 Tax=Rhizobium sp. Root482 TaxID=1736543 RepID=UPI0006F6F21F|nr:J domain-containing protein [Rhizobium sp. Root482]KQY26696.1 molecular chaperone DnaJ [Rhizobium sp. Root482]
MTSDTKIFVGLRPTRKKQAPLPDTDCPECQWADCEKPGTQRAPVGREAEGLYLLFCPKHAQEYIKGYNFSPNLSAPATAQYQREAASGLRPTWGTIVDQTWEIPLPSTARSGSAKATNARRSAAQRQVARIAFQARKLKVMEARAFEALGLSPEATPEEIKIRYKQRLKMHHPDANQGDRNSEDQLQASIDAYKILKLNGFC